MQQLRGNVGNSEKKNRNYLIQIKVANIKIQSLMCVSMYIYITKKKKKNSEKYQVRTVLVRN
jgi:hypothetical protein